MYETEAATPPSRTRRSKSQTCIAAEDFDAFQRELMEQYQKSPQFVKDCQLNDTKTLPNGFAFAMHCKDSKTILTFRFTNDMVSSTIENLIEMMPKYSSSILTMMRRIGDCPGQQPRHAL